MRPELDLAMEKYGWSAASEADVEAIAVQIGRRPRGTLAIARRCWNGRPLVVVNDPLPTHSNKDGRGYALFPTLFWLSCPSVARAVGRLEARGWIGEFRARLSADRDWVQRMEAVHSHYARLRLALADPQRRLRLQVEAPREYDVLAKSGVGGARRRMGVKCLHAHLADYLARTPPLATSSDLAGEPVNVLGRETALLLAKEGVGLRGGADCAACGSPDRN